MSVLVDCLMSKAWKPHQTLSGLFFRGARARARESTSRRRGRAHSAATDGPGALLRVRHYCQGIGDCHLLKFKKHDGSDFWMLIDCGVHSSVTGGSQKIAEIVADIASMTKRIDVLVVTHEHRDHVSGFLTEEEQFKKFAVGEVWMAWTEDPNDQQARDLDKFKQQALNALQMASNAFDRAGQLSPFSSQLHRSLNSVLGFSFELKRGEGSIGRDAAAGLVAGGPRYFEPGREPITIPGLPDLRIYVLGPPRDEKLLGLTEQVSEMYGLGGQSGWPVARALEDAVLRQTEEFSTDEDWWAPFDVHAGAPLSRIVAAIADGSELDELNTRLVDFVNEHYAGPAIS